jgi:hypothetical protein
VRQNDEEFEYSIKDKTRDGPSEKHESTLSVTQAVLRHKGKYQCNINHENAHHLHVNPAPVAIESEEKLFESENDHEDQRMRYERPIENDNTVASTVMMTFVVEEVTESPKPVSSYDNSDNYYDEDKSHEKLIDESLTTNEGSFSASDYETTAKVLTTTSELPPRLTDLPFHSTNINIVHPTHATTHTNHHVAHTTHAIPSEVLNTQTHPDNHGHKGSQKMMITKKMIRKRIFL